jgi:dephospho-CoA kinase
MILLGLTGSIGMGKSTTAAMFGDEGVPVYDADAAVHELYGPGGAAVRPVEAAFPGVVEGEAIHRGRLGERVLNDPEALKRLEAIVHPLVGAHRQDFFVRATATGAKIVVLDVPLLFETGGDKAMAAVVVVSAPAEVQRDRVMAREGMSREKLDAILDRQTPDAEKRARADFVIDTGQGLEAARAQVKAILQTLAEPGWRSTRIDAPAPHSPP